MNNIQALTDSIINQAQLEADLLLKEEREKIKLDKASAENELEARFTEKKRHLEDTSNERIKMAEVRKKSMLQKERTRYKLSLLEKLFDEVYSELCDMSAQDFLSYYKMTIESEELKGAFTVRVGEKSVKHFTDSDWDALSLKNDSCEISVDRQTIPNEGGFMLTQSALEYSFLFREQLQEIKLRSGSVILKQILD